MVMKHFISFFDRLEDRARFRLSRNPILYALIGSVGIILMWKGVWEMAELLPLLFGPVSFVLGVVILLWTGLLVSFYIGDSIILSGFRREKKLAEKTEKEIKYDTDLLKEIATRLERIEKKINSDNV